MPPLDVAHGVRNLFNQLDRRAGNNTAPLLDAVERDVGHSQHAAVLHDFVVNGVQVAAHDLSQAHLRQRFCYGAFAFDFNGTCVDMWFGCCELWLLGQVHDGFLCGGLIIT